MVFRSIHNRLRLAIIFTRRIPARGLAYFIPLSSDNPKNSVRDIMKRVYAAQPLDRRRSLTKAGH